MKTISSLIILILLFTLTNFTNAQWVEIGNDIDGEAPGDKSGCSVSINHDGSIVTIGATLNHGYNGDSLYSGQVRVYFNNSGTWLQLGNDIDGENQFHCSGISVDIDSTGNTIAVGAHSNSSGYTDGGYVKVYENNGGNWILKGNKIQDPPDFSGDAGQSVSLSSDGNTVAVGAPDNSNINGTSSGQVRVYEFNGIDWIQKGNSIYGDNAGDNAGRSVIINSEGSIVAIGSPYNDDNGNYSGHVRIFEYLTGSWVQMGSAIVGVDSLNYSGRSISLSSDGLTIAIGAPNNIGIDTTGHVRIFEYTGGIWQQKGSDIEGETKYSESGFSVSLSSDGNIVAIGAPYNGWPSSVNGHVRIYAYTTGMWQQIGGDIDGEASFDEFGYSVSLSSDGNIVAVGAMNNDGADTTDSGRGHVRIYNFATGINENITDSHFSIYPNPTTGLVIIKNEECRMNNVSVFDIYGKEVLETEVGSQKTEIDLSKEAKGIYIIKVTTNKGVVVEKIILE